MKRMGLNSTLKLFLMVAILFSFGGVLSLFYLKVTEIFTFLIAVLLLITNNAFTFSTRLVTGIFVFYLFLLFSIIITSSPLSDYVILFWRIFIIFLVITAFKNDYKDIKRSLIKAFNVILILALINFLIVNFFPSIFLQVETKDGYKVQTLFYIFNHLGASHHLNGIPINRNQGIFWEPGILQIIANLHIYYILLESRKPLRKIMLPLAVVITTASTTGYIVFLIILLVWYFKELTFKASELVKLVGLTMSFTILVPIMQSEFQYKFKDEGKASSVLRQYDMLMGLQVALQHPIFGIGLSQERYKSIVGSQTVSIDNEAVTNERGNTNSVVSFLVFFGIPSTLVLLLALFRQKLFRYKPVFFVIFVICISSEPLSFTYLVLLLIVSAVGRDRIMHSPSTLKTYPNKNYLPNIKFANAEK